MASILFLIIIIFFNILGKSNSTEFIFNGFANDESNLVLQESSIIKPSGALKLTNVSKNVIGHAFFANPVQMFLRQNSPVSSFSTHFVFSIVTPAKRVGGFGLAFTISPAKEFPNAQPGQYLGIFNSTNDKSDLNRVFAVDFDTVNGFGSSSESRGHHVGININSLDSVAAKPAAYYIDSHRSENIDLESGDPIKAWIEYNGTTKNITVTIAPISIPKPAQPVCFFVSDLSSIFEQNMYVGFSASTGKSAASFHYILAWSFKTNGTAPLIDILNLPEVPKETTKPSLGPRIKAFIATLSCVVILLAMWVMYVLYKRKRKAEVLEEWELDCPHRFTYNELFKATKGFKPSEMIGAGGFGEVYKGTLPSSGSEIAVKKISRNSVQGVREFVSEVESLGRLRHKNLVNLQGWCKKKDDLLLVYDYIPYGSLDTLLYHPKNNFVLSWEQRKNILKGIASGLLYLHEEWEQVVIHRDIKSSNVLIDDEFNGRLGDFGLARLYSHGKVSHTTNVVGTIGYIAPELARTGKASTSSDVFAYGVLLLEVACGCRPIIEADSTPGYLILVDWVMECQQMGKILEVADSKLGENYDVEEMNLLLKLGLVCSHPRQSSRPTMRQVLRYLNGEDKLCEIEDWHSSADSFDKLTSRFLEVISDDSFTKSIPRSSLTGISLNSLTRSIPGSSVANLSSKALGSR